MHSQTTIFYFILGQEKIGSGTPPIEKAVLASTAIGVGYYWPGVAPLVRLVRFSPDHFLLRFIIHS